MSWCTKQEEAMRNTYLSAILGAAALAAISPTAASAQADTNNTADTQYTTVEREDNDFPWGLLGLLGLAGLLGRKRKDDIHVDARHNNTRP
jgi:MYXO-CTERM domain-containing protein